MARPRSQAFTIPCAERVLDNGLRVVVHADRRHPVVAVEVAYHVGSAREQPGRSGFAHLFEHLMFEGSEHVGRGEHFRLVSEAGGTLNGTTNRDRTNYFETLPSHQVELAFWLESDRMGFLLPALTQQNLENQRAVVKNERRQSYENRPYGRLWDALATMLYPAGHPYSWLTIGTHEDIDAATLDDVRAFFRRWYGPGNATLAVAGDIDEVRAVELAERWFGSLPRGPEVPAVHPRGIALPDDVRVHLDDDVQVPELALAWPTAPLHHDDEAPLVMLAAILSANKASLLDRALTVDATLASMITAYQHGSELAGELHVRARPIAGVPLDVIESTVREVLARLARDGVDPDHLARMQTHYEAGVINGLETAWARANALASASLLLGDARQATATLQRVLAVTPEQVHDVLVRYLVDRPAVAVSIVPRGRTAAAVARSVPLDERASPAREVGAPPAASLPHGAAAPRVAASAPPAAARAAAPPERGRAPPPAAPGRPQMPPVTHARIGGDGGGAPVPIVAAAGINIPVSWIGLGLPAGHVRGTPPTLGVASLASELMQEGTRALDTIALTDALDALGGRIEVTSRADELVVGLRVLDKHLERGLELLVDVALHPRFDPGDLERLRAQRLTRIDSRGDSPRGVASRAWRRLLFGTSTCRGLPIDGTRETIEALRLDDVRAFHARHAVPGGARVLAVGRSGADALAERLQPLVAGWSDGAVPPLGAASPLWRDVPEVFLIDRPGAPQSEIRIGHGGPPATHPDFFALGVLNYVLGGAFSSRVNLNLREDKGYTYGASTRFSGSRLAGIFTASAAVHTAVTAPAVAELMAELGAIRDGVTPAELAFARDALRQGLARNFESMAGTARLVDEISAYGWPDDYPLRRLEELAAMTTDRLAEVAGAHLHPDRVAILVVGDADAVRADLAALGHGEITELDLDGVPLDAAVR